MPLWSFLKTEFIADAKASLPVRDLAFQRAYGIFDFFRLVRDRPVFLSDHLDRFYFSASQMRLPVAFSREELKLIIQELIIRNESRDTGIRLSLTGGVSDDGISIGQPNLVITEHDFSHPSEEQQKRGIHLMTYEHRRQLPEIKTIDYILPVWLQPLLQEKGVNDVLYHYEGKITECPRSNFFLVTDDDKIITADKNVLKGVTRNRVIELAKKKYEIEERNIALHEILSAREAFITSTTKKLLPVAAIDGKEFDMSKNKLSRYLLQELEAHISQSG